MWWVVEIRQQLVGDYRKDKYLLSKHPILVNNDCDFYQDYEIYVTILLFRDFCEVKL